MANVYLQEKLKNGVKGAVAIFGKIQIAAGGAVSSFDINLVQSVTKTGVGEYTVLLKQAWVKHIATSVQVLSATNQDLVPQLKSVDVAVAKTIVIKTMTAAAPADAVGAIELHLISILQNTSVKV